MKILLHICCAPCAIHPFKELFRKSENSVTGFFYNPNIHPADEEEKRRSAVIDYAKMEDFKVIFGEYNEKEFFDKVGTEQAVPSRCRICWRMRLEKTAEIAKKEQFNAFTTTLLVSPYQDQYAIKEIGAECGARFGVRFLGLDFREGFRAAQVEAKKLGLYRQNYCGCLYSRNRR